MIRLMVMNGLLICLILIWTSSASEPTKELRPEDRTEAQSRSNDDSQNISKKPNAYAFASSVSAEEDDIDIANFNIINPHLGNDHTITRYGNHTFTRARGVDQKESVLNSPIRELKSGSQLLFFSAGKLSWIDAQKDCKARNGALAVLGDEPEDVFAYISENIGRKYFWLGGSDIKEEGTWFWLNGDPIDPTKYWRKGEPNGGKSDDCLYLYRGIYYDRSCKREYNYICDLESDDNIPFHERTQYLSFSDDSLSWEDAKANCEAKQGTLAILEDEPDDVFAHIASHYAGITFWLGGSDIAKEGDWLWLNGNPIDLTKYWRRNEPNNWWGGEDCLQYYYGYNDRSCRRRYRYICDLGAPSTAAPTTAAPTTAAPTTAAPPTAAPTTAGPATTAPSITHNNATSCSLVWNYAEDRPLIMIRETKTIVPPVTDVAISHDPNRIPEGKKLIFACPGENNQFNHVQGTHTKLHGECISRDLFKVCVNNYPEIMDLGQLSCSRQMFPSVIKQDNDTIYKKSCDGIGGELYKFGYIYGDYREFKDLETKVCFHGEDQTTLWTSTNDKRIEISPSMHYKDPSNFRAAKGFAINRFYSKNSLKNISKEVMDNEAILSRNDKRCRDKGGYCVRGGKPCPEHLPHQTSQGKPFCSSFYRCCHSGTMHQLNSVQERQELSKLLRGKTCGGGGGTCTNLRTQKEKSHQRMNQDCDLGWNTYVCIEGVNTFVGREPLINRHGDKKILFPRAEHATWMVFSCPGVGNTFRDGSISHPKGVQCWNGKLQHHNELGQKDIELHRLGCKYVMTPSVIPYMIGNEHSTCGDNNNGNLYNVLYETAQQMTVFHVCFWLARKTTLWTSHLIDGQNIRWHYGISSGTFGDRFGFWNVQSGAYGVNHVNNIDDLYKVENQILLNQHLNIQIGLADDPLVKLERGHMAARADFVTPAEQRASYVFVNAMPQWKYINNGNWKKIEDSTRLVASCLFANLGIYTGTHNVMNINNQDAYLGVDSQNNNIVPVPHISWKVVYSDTAAVAFVVYNYPENPSTNLPHLDDLRQVCVCRSGEVNWLYIPPSRLNDRKYGLTICLSAQNFRASGIVFPALTNKAENNILKL